MKRPLLIAVGLIVSLVIGSSAIAAPGSSDTKRVDSTLTLAYDERTTPPSGPYSPTPGNPYNPSQPTTNSSFSGDVGSAKKACRRGRDVSVKNVGTSQVVGTDKTDRAGNYEIGAASRAAADGTYRAKAKKKIIERKNGKRIVCRRTSAKVTVS